MNSDFLKSLQIKKTGDGSSSLYMPEAEEHYHSQHGAIRESQHVFIERGLNYFLDNHYLEGEIRILEMGFGTGLNAYLSALLSETKNIRITYHSVDAFPLPENFTENLNFPDQLTHGKASELFEKIHEVSWGRKHHLSSNFQLFKEKAYFQNFQSESKYDLLFYDAFGSRVQPELWTEDHIAKVAVFLKKPGVMVTYAAKGNFKRGVQKVGLKVEKLEGPPGKREMMRAERF